MRIAFFLSATVALVLFTLGSAVCSHFGGAKPNEIAHPELIENRQSSDLIEAIKSRNLQKLTERLRSGFDPNERDQNGYTLLQIAMGIGDNEIVRLLLESGADPNQKIVIGNHPLFLAILRDDDELAIQLLKHGADANTTAGDRSVLLDSVIKDRYSVVTVLLERGANPNSSNQLGRIPLFYVSDGAVTQLLIDKGALVNFKDSSGLTPVFAAITEKKLSVLKVLTKHGANLNEEDHDGWRPLQEALVVGCEEIVTFLRLHGAVL